MILRRTVLQSHVALRETIALEIRDHRLLFQGSGAGLNNLYNLLWMDGSWRQGITAMALISSSSSGRASATTCTIVLVGKFDPKISRRVSLMSR